MWLWINQKNILAVLFTKLWNKAMYGFIRPQTNSVSNLVAVTFFYLDMNEVVYYDNQRKDLTYTEVLIG